METTLNTNNTNGGNTSDSITRAVGGQGSISNLFTTLLVAQIKNQNPLEPTDPSQFVGQLTQLSQMEALQKMTDQGAANASMLSSLQMLALGGQVGSSVTVKTDQLTLTADPVQIGFTLGSNSTQNTLVLKSFDGSEKRIEIGTRNAGEVSFTMDPATLGLPKGTYSASIETSSKENPTLEVTGQLSSVQVAGSGSALLNVVGVGRVSPGSLTRFNGPSASPSL